MDHGSEIRSFNHAPPAALLLSSIPLLLTLVATAAIAQQRIFPVLSTQDPSAFRLPVFHDEAPKAPWRRPSARKLARLVFSSSLGLSTVLIELLLCEITNTLHPAAREVALRLVLKSLLVLSIVLTPALEIHSFAEIVWGMSSDTSTQRTKRWLRLVSESSLVVAWLLVFWYIPQAAILRHVVRNSEHDEYAFAEACLERVGVIGICLMACLAGFAAVSSLWQTFGVRHPPVRDEDIARKEAGLKATDEMLNVKQSRLRALQSRLADPNAPTPSLLGRVIGSVKGDAAEVKSLKMEVEGLETMRYTLTSSLSALKTRHSEQQRAKTSLGKAVQVTNSLFAVYCAYRICATSISGIRRWLHPSHTYTSSTDPINNFLALLTTHLNSNLDRAAWSRQISFLLAGVMLSASFNAVLQTFRLFARFAPAWLKRTQSSSLSLVISQIVGTYVISSALLLRSNLPADMGGAISQALGAPLEKRFVEAWFEYWFLVAVGLTAVGIWIGRKLNGDDDDDDNEGKEV
ncbi:hypothetical protein K470DRAFT_258446 [Piedraia hortae CBS 480.64]|uniref:Abscisic acid G-protein coupled receptor-like domain-containing protein n=1 Tax=Piedraia hortae CBS 480.64 TaxID=1314780 RepID=A0A6A7BXI0_9PEZI|nr:hypothetical protein K470DRAFT_258446 [Piedraia hortae CBS 480.64]